MRNISIRTRGILSGLDALLPLLLDTSLGELDEFLTLCVYPRVVLVTINIVLICGLLAFKKTLLAYSTFAFLTGFDPSWAIQRVVQTSFATSKPSLHD
jgi:hypothetical protein